MIGGWIFIVVSWAVAIWIYLRGFRADTSALEAAGRSVVCMLICFGSLWVPELWL